jgi:hypothetical protein
VTAAAVVWYLRTVGPWASLGAFKTLEGPSMSDAPRQPPPLPQNALIWIVVASLLLVLVRAVWRGLL